METNLVVSAGDFEQAVKTAIETMSFVWAFFGAAVGWSVYSLIRDVGKRVISWLRNRVAKGRRHQHRCMFIYSDEGMEYRAAFRIADRQPAREPARRNPWRHPGQSS